ncbi:MAG TPA: hypothetical protein VIU45_08295 [Chitinophagaceae bacterium]
MIVKFDKIEDISDGIVKFYSVRLRDNMLTEFEIFDAKDFPNHIEELEIMYATINEMKIRGAKPYYFKPEGPANALPKVKQKIIVANQKDFGLRLYCIRLTDEVVVLLNGGIKTQRDPKNCPNVKPYFEMAIKIAKVLDKALVDKEINYQEIDCLDHFEIEI